MAEIQRGTWEYQIFGARASFDDTVTIEKSKRADFDNDGAASQGVLRQEIAFDDDGFAGVRVGYFWVAWLETELSYDRNHTSGSYEMRALDRSSGPLQSGSGDLSAVVTTYQFAFLYHPLGERQTRWQPFAQIGGGWQDTDITPSSGAAQAARSFLVESVFGESFPNEDNGLLLTYGLGLKYELVRSFSVRAEYRGKRYSLFDDQTGSGEFALGISFYVGGEVSRRF